MSSETKKIKEPFVRIIKRDGASIGNKVLIRALAIVLALVVDAIFIFAVTGLNPISVYGVMFNGTFMTSIRFSWALRDLVTLLCIGIALAPAFKMKFWNIGAEGQVLAGGLATALVMVKCGQSSSNTCIASGYVSCKHYCRRYLGTRSLQFLRHIGIQMRLCLL